MRIVIDGRPLMWHLGGGVPVFTKEIIHALARQGDHELMLWQNAWSKLSFGPLPVSVTMKQTHIPNKILNPLLRIAQWPKIDALTDEADVFFLPNLNFISKPKHGKVVVTVHDLSFIRAPHFFNLKQRLWHKALNVGKLFETVDHIVAVSQHTKDDLLELFPKIHTDKVSVIGIGIDVPTVSGGEITKAQETYILTKPYILHVGTLEPRKNIVNLMRAFETVANSYELDHYDLVLVGAKGWGWKDVEREHQKSSVKNRIKILGSIPDADKHALMAGAKLFVYPSWYEGFGIPPLEAAAHGVPVIASSVTAMPETLGDSALLVNPWDVAGLGQAMVAMMSDDVLRARYAAKGKERAAHYRWEDVAHRLVKVFENRYSTFL